MNNISRTDKVTSINICFSNATNDQVIEMYNMFVKNIMHMEIKILNRKSMVEHVLDNINIADDMTIDELYLYAHDNNLMNDNGLKCIKVNNKNKIVNDKNIMYNIVLNVVNDLLETIGRDKIERLEDFKEIRRDELMQNKCKDVIENNKEYIFSKFKKAEIRYYQRDTLTTFVISALKGMVNKLADYQFISKNHKNKKITKGSQAVNFTSYSVKKINV
jgi:hypothetical protein